MPNPASLGGGSGLLDPIAPSKPFYTGSILSAANALLGFTFPRAGKPDPDRQAPERDIRPDVTPRRVAYLAMIDTAPVSSE